jgi:Prophage CP4-57 regulatory protein (AlpA)
VSRKEEAKRIESEISFEADDAKRLDPGLNAQRLLRVAEVLTMLGVSRSSIYNYITEDKFPAPIKLERGVCGGSSQRCSRGGRR